MTHEKEKDLHVEFEGSSNILKASYDPFMRVLTVFFISGGKYEYIDVEKNVFLEMSKIDSPGKFFHKYIKNKYDFLKRITIKQDQKPRE